MPFCRLLHWPLTVGLVLFLHISTEWLVNAHSIEEIRGKAAELWSTSFSASGDNDDSEEFDYVYVDENGDYYDASEDSEDYNTGVDWDSANVAGLSSSAVVASGYCLPSSLSRPPTLRPFSLLSTLLELETAAFCQPRNHSHTQKLRDDHQLNLKQEKEEKKEKRREKREKKAQEVAEMEEEQDDKRFKMSRMNSNELQEQEAHVERIERAILAKKAEEAELAKSNSKTLGVGDRVMARYQRKAKYLFGYIVNVRVDGSYDIIYDIGKDELHIDKSLIIKPESEREVARGTKIGVNEEQRAQVTSLKEQQRKELQAQRALHEELLQQEEEERLELEKDPGRPVGADCESQACGACKLVVDEYAQRVHRHINNKEVQTLAALLDYTTPLCDSPQITHKYSGVVEIVCKKMFSARDHKEFFIRTFEADSDWDNVMSATTLLPKKQQICQSSGFCSEDAFEYERDEDDGWGSDECFVCHAVMEDMEEKATLFRSVDDMVGMEITQKACDNLVLSPSLARKCAEFTFPPLQVDAAWVVKLHHETIQKAGFTHRNFPDLTCEGLGKCERWVDPEGDAREQTKNEVEPVFA